MISPEITADLRAGLSLEETLIKYNTNLRELFATGSDCVRQPKVIGEWDNIQLTKCNSFRVYKYINGTRTEFGTYQSPADARCVRDNLILCNWDKTQLQRIISQHRIEPRKHGGARR